MPPYWRKPVYELDPHDPNNNGFINEDFIIWMREAAFPNFKKLYGILNRNMEPFADGLPAGNYTISIAYSILSALCFTTPWSHFVNFLLFSAMTGQKQLKARRLFFHRAPFSILTVLQP